MEIVTSATLMATGPAFERRSAAGKNSSGPERGCHALLIDGEPVLDGTRLPTITYTRSGKARFRDGLKSFAARALTGRLNPDEIEAETAAQIRQIHRPALPFLTWTLINTLTCFRQCCAPAAARQLPAE